jgi:hypothetical protein
VPQLFATVYDIVAVPVATPVTIPVLPAVAIVVVPLLHVPPVAVLVKVVPEATQSDDVPEMVPASGIGLTVTMLVAASVPQLFVTV